MRKIIDYQAIFTQLYTIKNLDSFLFLDDLYHIIRNDQPNLLNYFHKIAKGNNLWIKIATIRNRTSWYVHTPQPIGVKIGDDIEEINLDLTLEKFSTLKEFLKTILNLYITETKAPKLTSIINESGVDRLVLSSGGVARDFLGLFRRSIDEARERLKKSNYQHPRGDKIGAEDVNIAAGNYGELKREEFQRDTLEDRKKLEECYNRIKFFCLDITKQNIFLVDQQLTGGEIDLLQELLDLRLVHQIRSRVTVSSRPGKIYKSFLLDVSQYTGERARRDVEMIEFWRDTEKEKLRRVSSIYDPFGKSSGDRQQISKDKPKPIINEKDDNDSQQMTLDIWET